MTAFLDSALTSSVAVVPPASGPELPASPPVSPVAGSPVLPVAPA